MMVLPKSLGTIAIGLAALLSVLSFSAQAAERGEDLYKNYCWQCHGMNADGMGVNIPDMSVQPRDHTDTKKMKARTDEELYKAIKDGGQAIDKSILMPAWGEVLSEEDIQNLVRYLRELCRC